MATRLEKVVCTRCAHIHEITAYPRIDVIREPELKEKLLNGELLTWQCPVCTCTNLARYPLVYLDSAQKLLLILSEAVLSVESCPEGYLARQVETVGELLEKIKIFDSGLDDIVIEICKYVTLQELGKNIELKFLKTDGADSSMTFTYPWDGKMEMLEVGFNVYEDCAGILHRNPAMLNSLSALPRIDRNWLGQWISG